MRLKYSELIHTNDVCESSKCVYNASGEHICEEVEREIYHYRQVSLSEDKLSNDNSCFGRKEFDLQQMWGLYVDRGFGVCLLFDKSEFLKCLPKDCTHESVT